MELAWAAAAAAVVAVAEAEEEAEVGWVLEPAALEEVDGGLLLEEALVAALWARKATSRFARKGRLVGILYIYLGGGLAPGVFGVGEGVICWSPPESCWCDGWWWR